MTIKTVFKTLLLGIAAATLAACSSDDISQPRPCPGVLIPSDTATLTRFKPGPGRAIIDVQHQEKVVGFGHACTYDTDDAGAGFVRVQIAPTILSERGPADTTKQADFEYYVAIVDSQKRVIEKMRRPVQIPFVGNLTRVQWQPEQPHQLNLPISADMSGADYTIYIGLQLSRAELDYNLNKR